MTYCLKSKNYRLYLLVVHVLIIIQSLEHHWDRACTSLAKTESRFPPIRFSEKAAALKKSTSGEIPANSINVEKPFDDIPALETTVLGLGKDVVVYLKLRVMMIQLDSLTMINILTARQYFQGDNYVSDREYSFHAQHKDWPSVILKPWTPFGSKNTVHGYVRPLNSLTVDTN